MRWWDTVWWMCWRCCGSRRSGDTGRASSTRTAVHRGRRCASHSVSRSSAPRYVRCWRRRRRHWGHDGAPTQSSAAAARATLSSGPRGNSASNGHGAAPGVCGSPGAAAASAPPIPNAAPDSVIRYVGRSAYLHRRRLPPGRRTKAGRDRNGVDPGTIAMAWTSFGVRPDFGRASGVGTAVSVSAPCPATARACTSAAKIRTGFRWIGQIGHRQGVDRRHRSDRAGSTSGIPSSPPCQSAKRKSDRPRPGPPAALRRRA